MKNSSVFSTSYYCQKEIVCSSVTVYHQKLAAATTESSSSELEYSLFNRVTIHTPKRQDKNQTTGLLLHFRLLPLSSAISCLQKITVTIAAPKFIVAATQKTVTWPQSTKL